MININIAQDFSTTPAGRTESDHGSNSGETFRRNLLGPKLKEAIKSNSILSVTLDGTAGYPASFLDEAFGGLIREDNFKKSDLKKYLVIRAEDDVYKVYEDMCHKYIADTEPS